MSADGGINDALLPELCKLLICRFYKSSNIFNLMLRVVENSIFIRWPVHVVPCAAYITAEIDTFLILNSLNFNRLSHFAVDRQCAIRCLIFGRQKIINVLTQNANVKRVIFGLNLTLCL